MNRAHPSKNSHGGVHEITVEQVADNCAVDQTQLKINGNQRTAVIIGNYMEEYQTLADELPEIAYEQVAPHLMKHPMVKGRYCFVRDNEGDSDEHYHEQTDENTSISEVELPTSEAPILGLSQPSMNQLCNLIRKCVKLCPSIWMLLNVRNDPCIFVKVGNDWLPYTVRDYKKIQVPLTDIPRRGRALDTFESEIRDEILHDLKALRQDSFYFYDDITFFENQPVIHIASQPDYLLLTEEVYTNVTQSEGDIRYLRMSFPPMNFPREEEVDRLLFVLKDLLLDVIPSLCSNVSLKNMEHVLGFIISGQNLHDGTIQLGMVMASLILRQFYSLSSNGQQVDAYHCEWSKLFTKRSKACEADKSTDHQHLSTVKSRQHRKSQKQFLSQLHQNIKAGKFQFIRHVGRYLPYMVQIKEEVDKAIDDCGDVMNIREAILESVLEFEAGIFSRDMDQEIRNLQCLENTLTQLERYHMLICFNAYLRDQVSLKFTLDFSEWMRRHPKLYQTLEFLDVSEWHLSVDLLKQTRRYLVADNTTVKDELCTAKSTGIANFRQLLGWPIYGASQPNADSLCHVHAMITTAYWNVALKGMRVDETLSRSVVEEASRVPVAMPKVLWISLRNEYVISCGSETYSWREKDKFSTEITLKGIGSKEMEELEEKFAEDIKKLTMSCKPFFYDIETGTYRQGDSIQNSEVLSTKQMFTVALNTKPISSASSKSESPGVNIPESYWEYVRKNAEYHRIPIPSRGPPPAALFDSILRLVVNNARGLLTSTIAAQSLVNASAGMGRRQACMRRQHSTTDNSTDWHLPTSNQSKVDRITSSNLIFFCESGRERTSLAMCVAGLVYCHLVGFSYGYRVEEEERISLRDAKYTKGEFEVIQQLIRRVPRGNQVKREVDYVLDRCFDSMSMMHFHVREEIYFTYMKSREEKEQIKAKELRRKSLAQLEEYFFLILFNMYLHDCKVIRWKQSFDVWMEKVTKKCNYMELLDNFGFWEFEKPQSLHRIRERWRPHVSSNSSSIGMH